MSDSHESNGHHLRLDKPAMLTLEVEGSDKSVSIDVIEAWTMLVESSKQPTVSAKWDYIRKWVAARLQVEPGSLAQNQLWEFNDVIIAMGKRVESRIRELVSSIASLQQPIQASQATTLDGQSSVNEPGLQTSLTS